MQLAGYRYDSYTPSQAQVAIVVHGPAGQAGRRRHRRWCWRGGDWKYLFPTGGTPPMQVIADLTGYVPWSSF